MSKAIRVREQTWNAQFPVGERPGNTLQVNVPTSGIVDDKTEMRVGKQRPIDIATGDLLTEVTSERDWISLFPRQ